MLDRRGRRRCSWSSYLGFPEAFPAAEVQLGSAFGPFTGVTAAGGLRDVPEQKVDPPHWLCARDPHSL